MKTLIVPLDGTSPASNALEGAGVLARALGADVELLHVVVPSHFSTANGTNSVDPTTVLNCARASLPADLNVHIKISEGDPATKILERIQQIPEAVIAVQSRGRKGLSRALLGSVSDHIVRTAPVPVIVTRDTMRFPRRTLNVILVPLDSSPLSERAIPYAVELAKRTEATIEIVSVVDVSQMSAYAGIDRRSDVVDCLENEARDAALVYLDDWVKRIRAEGLRATWEVRLGRPADEIIRAAETTDTDLVVMSTHGRGGLRRWAFGSVTDDVVQRGDCPVLIVPATP
jgi:nucleotide-binding universal stress UspA family protein